MAINPATDPHNSPNAGGAPVGPGYETRDASIPALLKFAVSLAAIIAVVAVGMRWTRDYYAKTQNLGPTATPFENERIIPPLPRLQVAPQKEIHEYWESEQGLVNSYGWVDRQRGVVRIPVDRAMRILLQRGFPARTAGGAKAASAGGEPPAGGAVQ
jgi:hypothetical protein